MKFDDKIAKAKILVVDDVSANLQAMRRILSEIDADIIEVENGYDALEVAINQEIALVLLDVQMPEIDGYQVAEAIRNTENTKHTPIIFVTANSTEESNIMTGYEVGAVDYITKPLNPIILISKVKIFLELYQQNKKLELMNSALDAARKEADGANKAKSEFLANMSHEIRTPMNGIMGMGELLEETELSKIQRNYVRVINRSGEALLGLINDVLDFSKIEAGELNINLEQEDIGHIFQSVMELQAANIHHKDLELVLEVAETVPAHAITDGLRLRQIITNLVGNAIKFTSKGHVLVRVDYKEDDQLLCIDVRDTGIGIAQDKVDRVFESFSQADLSTTKQYGGTGLGLSITKSLCDLLGGKIILQSELNRGTTFQVQIPIEAVSNEDGTIDQLKPRDLSDKPQSICIVTDSHISGQVLERTLKGWDIPTVDCCGSVDPKKAYDLYIIDETQDYEPWLERLVGRKSRKVYMTSSAAKGRNVEAILDEGFDDLLYKPFSPGTILSILSESENSGQSAKARGVPREFDAKILLVEDDAINRFFAMEILGKTISHVDIAENGEEAVAMVQKNTYDLIFMDCMMPILDGYGASQQIREWEKGQGKEEDYIPIVAMTANAMEGDKEKCLASGMSDYIPKPAKSKNINKMLEKYLG